MFNNYQYFIVLAEECNISRAADRLFITHQNLSRYLANLEAEFGVTLFERRPVFRLTYAGRLMLQALKDTEQAEKNLRARYADLRQDSAGEIRLGTTEGRFRILMPDIISDFKEAFPDVQLLISSAPSPELRKMVQNGQLDLMVAGVPRENSERLEYSVVLEEKLYLVISDHMLNAVFGEKFPACKEKLAAGADLRLFQALPFAMNLPHLNSSIMLQRHLERLGITLNCVHTSSHPDLHHMMSARDFAVSFCLTMYLPSLLRLNEDLGNKLNIFPIEGLTETNPVAVCHAANRIFPRYTRTLLRMLREHCGSFAEYDGMVNGKLGPLQKTDNFRA